MKHKCKITVLRKECYKDLQEEYLTDPQSGEAWDAVSRYIYTALQDGSIMEGWTKDEKVMIAYCNDGTRPVVLKIEHTDEE